jgi:hypothetical protein
VPPHAGAVVSIAGFAGELRIEVSTAKSTVSRKTLSQRLKYRSLDRLLGGKTDAGSKQFLNEDDAFEPRHRPDELSTGQLICMRM